MSQAISQEIAKPCLNEINLSKAYFIPSAESF
jgi:hypothetical protein